MLAIPKLGYDRRVRSGCLPEEWHFSKRLACTLPFIGYGRRFHGYRMHATRLADTRIKLYALVRPRRRRPGCSRTYFDNDVACRHLRLRPFYTDMPPPRPPASSMPKPKTSLYRSRIQAHCSDDPSHLTDFATSVAPSRLEGRL